jgi:hypothetical protein
MNDAAQIRRCSDALRAGHSLLQPPDPKIPNRESRPSKTYRSRTNRENTARLAPHPNPKISNRESRHSNREVTAASTRKCQPSNPVPEPRRLVRARLQSCRHRDRFLPASAAEGMFLRFSLTICLPSQPARRSQLTPPTSNFHSKNPNFQPSKKAKSIKNHPQSLFRLERTPIPYFQQLTRNLNEPMFRLETNKGGKKPQAQPGGSKGLNVV